MNYLRGSNLAMVLFTGALVYLGAKAIHHMMHDEQNNATKLMGEATDKAISTVRGIKFEESGRVLDRFNSQIDKASDLASARVRKIRGL